jgi:hypothetical protein
VKVISIGEIFDQFASLSLAKVMKASSSQMSSDSVLFLQMFGVASHTCLLLYCVASNRTWCKNIAPSAHSFRNVM